MSDTFVSQNVSTADSAVSWPAIIAGALTAMVVSLAIFTLGSGLGLAAASPFDNDRTSVVAVTAGAAVWIVVMQWLSSALGGYITGRLRTKWTGLHSNEVFFRDTAHGFLAWTLATLLTVVLASHGIMGGARAGAHAERMADRQYSRPAPAPMDHMGKIARAVTPETDNTVAPEVRADTMRIITDNVNDPEFKADDKPYLTKVVADRAGVSETEATARVDAVYNDVIAADKARKAAATLTLVTFVSMLIGAAIASAAATAGGRHRDHVWTA